MKQRLIGAVVLVALAVIFLPMLIKGPAPDSGVADVSMDVPPTPASAQYETRELPLVTPEQAPPDGVVGMPAARSPAGSPGTEAGIAPEDAAKRAAELPAATAAGAFAVSFGAYASTRDADAVVGLLRQANLPGFIEPASINGKPAWRVRIGPYADRAQAEIVRLEAGKVRNDVNAQVIALDAAEPATDTAQADPAAAAESPQPAPATGAQAPKATAPPATAAATPTPETPAEAAPPAAIPPAATQPVPPPPAPAAGGIGYAVQLGAFSKADDANALRDKVRGAGFSAFVEPVNTDKGVLHRVRAGPVADRGAADAMKAQIAARTGVSGLVRPHP